MRYYLYLFFSIVFAFHSFAQTLDVKSSEFNQSKIKFGNVNDSFLPKWNLNEITPVITGSDQGKLVLFRDTLNDFVKESTGFTTYAVTIQGNTYPLTGWNPFYLFLGQKFNFVGSASVTEILFSAIGKQSIGTKVDSILGMVFAGEPTQGLPTSNLGTSWIMFNEIDTSSTAPIYSSIKFTNPVPISGKFVTMLLTFNGTNEYDAVILYSNMQGNGKGQKNLCMVFNNDGNLNAINYTDFWNQVGLKMQDGNPPDFDALIFPIVESGGNVNNAITLNGFTLEKVSPNPANEYVDFNFNLEKHSNVYIDIVGLDGKILLSSEKQNCFPGDHKINFNLLNLSSGNYYYLIRTDFTKFGGKFSIVR